MKTFKIIWPERRLVACEQLIQWASDDVDNGLHCGPKPTTVEGAIAILQDTGSVTFSDSQRAANKET